MHNVHCTLHTVHSIQDTAIQTFRNKEQTLTSNIMKVNKMGPAISVRR